MDESQVNPANDKIFWWTLALFTLIWLVLTIVNIFRLDITEVLICLFCGLMIGFNLYSYYQCSKAQSENVRKLAFQYGQALGTVIVNGFPSEPYGTKMSSSVACVYRVNPRVTFHAKTS